METASKIAEEVAEKFNKEWEPVMENVREAAETFDNLEGDERCLSILLQRPALIGL